MNRNIALFVVLCIVSGAFVISYAVTHAATPTGMTVIAYDQSGNKVWETASRPDMIAFGWNNKNGPIYSIVVTVTYTVSGQDAGSAVSVSAVEKVYCGDAYHPDRDDPLKLTDGPGWSDTLATATHTTTYLVADLMKRSTIGDLTSYFLVFDVTITASGVSEGSSVTMPLPLTCSMAEIKWTDPTFSLTGTIGFV